MKQFVKRTIQKIFRAGLETSAFQAQLDLLAKQLAHAPEHPVDQSTQLLLTLRYQELLRSKQTLPAFGDVGFRAYSQNDEDGVLLFIFALIGTTNKKVVEVCAGTCVECNAANLIINHYWRGILFDGNAANIEFGRRYYAEHPNTLVRPPVFVHAWITPENINELITSNGFAGEVDLLSLDMDGMDYWILKAIECIQPRVIVLEHNSPWGAARAVTVPYQRDFVAQFVDGAPEYCGASLPAFVKLLRGRGYRLVGLETFGINAFFLRNDVGPDILPERTVESCFVFDPPTAAQQTTYEATLKRLEGRDYVEV